MVTQAVIMAGGRGTRLAPFTDKAPKPMYPVNGVPFIEHLVKQVRGFGVSEVVVLLGYLPEKIINHLGDGEKYGLKLRYDITPAEYETGDRFVHALPLLNNEFLYMYCDNYCPVDIQRLYSEFQSNEALIQISVYSNRDGYTKSNLTVDAGRVTVYDKKRESLGLQGVDIGYAICSKAALEYVTEKGQNFEAAVYPELIRQKKLFATVTEHRYYSIGSWERIKLTEEFFLMKPTVFLDRDGTLNVRPKRACYVEKPEDFVWLDGAKEAVGLLKKKGYRVILISNQPGIARGRLTEEILSEIHKKMQDELRVATGYEIDRIFYCPHDWDEGCECRKPKPGLLFKAQKEFSINLSQCVFFGDDERDMEAAGAAGCEGVLVGEEYPLLQAVKNYLKSNDQLHAREQKPGSVNRL